MQASLPRPSTASSTLTLPGSLGQTSSPVQPSQTVPNAHLPPVLGGPLPRTSSSGTRITRNNTVVSRLSASDPLTPLSNEEEAELLKLMQRDGSYAQQTEKARRRMVDSLRTYAMQLYKRKQVRLPVQDDTVASCAWWERRVTDELQTHLQGFETFQVLYPAQRRAQETEQMPGQINRLRLPLEPPVGAVQEPTVNRRSHRPRPSTTTAPVPLPGTTVQDLVPLGSAQAIAEAREANAALVPEDLVPIRLDVQVEPARLIDTLTWNAAERDVSIEQFALLLCDDLGLPAPVFVPAIKDQVEQQLAQHVSLASVAPPVPAKKDDLSWWTTLRERLAQLDPQPDQTPEELATQLEWDDTQHDQTDDLVLSSWAQADLRIPIKVRSPPHFMKRQLTQITDRYCGRWYSATRSVRMGPD